MATLVNKLNREVKVIIPNMREFSTFYSDKEGVLPMFFKRDWVPVKEEHWKPSKEQIGTLNYAYCELFKRGDVEHNILGPLQKLIDDLKKLM